MKNRDKFKTRWGFILACIGSAVGMGNIWRFPNLVATYGGLTFLLPYILFVVLIGSTGIIEEIALGRAAGTGPVGAFGWVMKKRGNEKAGRLIGLIPVLGSLALAIGYTVVVGWIFKYTFLAISGKMFAMGQDMAVIGGTFGQAAPEASSITESIRIILSKTAGNNAWLATGLIVTMIIMSFGIQGGIEKANKIMMPLLFCLMVILAVYIAFLPGAADGYKYIFSFNGAGFADPKVWLFAFGQAFFSLSVAGNGTVIYGSYFSKEEDIPSSAKNIAIFDTIAALLASFVIVPAVTASGVSMTGGPGLMFVYLVNVFNGMPGGRIVGVVFFIAVLFAGLSSLVNLYEAPVEYLQERAKVNRGTSVCIIGVLGVLIAVGIQAVTSQWMDYVSVFVCPLGALLAAIMFFWVLKKADAVEQVNLGGKDNISSWFYPLGKYVYCFAALFALVGGAIFYLVTGSSIG